MVDWSVLLEEEKPEEEKKQGETKPPSKPKPSKATKKPTSEKKEQKTGVSSLEKKIDLLLEKLERKELLDIELTEGNVIREFKTVNKLKIYELKRTFQNNTSEEIKKVVDSLLKSKRLKRNKNGWYSLA